MPDSFPRYQVVSASYLFGPLPFGPSSHHPQEVLLAQFSLYVHKGGLKPASFHLQGWPTAHRGATPLTTQLVLNCSVVMLTFSDVHNFHHNSLYHVIKLIKLIT